ncbi:hypothetical protein [Agarivorans litoreus]|uniref:hypothetical protein n=1 Tax=Agarivorans litoreus TaxID=1510455 RepID=UPI001C7D8545|nr:hypothetical protein [Agarivorans litoreus]
MLTEQTKATLIDTFCYSSPQILREHLKRGWFDECLIERYSLTTDELKQCMQLAIKKMES